nr:transposase domain-containing protein [Paraglaciecola sp. L3A3]
MVETAKANGLTPFNYVVHLLTELSMPEPDIELLLPWNVKLN